MKASTSFLVTRPRRPEPVTFDRSTLCSSAMRRTTGEIGGAWPLPVIDSTFGASSSTWASPGRAPASMVASTVPTSTVSPTCTASEATRPDPGAGRHPPGRRPRPLRLHLVGRDLDDRLVALHPVADALLPLDDRALRHRH